MSTRHAPIRPSFARLALARPLALLIASGCLLSIVPGAPGDTPASVGAAGARADNAEPLPIQKITLYRSGVGSFQRGGPIEGSRSVQLKFDVTQINDVLKSLQVLDLSGGRVESVSYASKDPLARRLASFSVPIADNPSMPELLGRLRGSGVTLKTYEGEIAGTVLSTEVRELPSGTGDKTALMKVPVVNLITPTGIRSVQVPAIQSLSLSDAQLQDEINRALAAMADSRAERVKTVDVKLAGDGQRKVVVAYVHETPVWKTSYRLVLPEADGKGTGVLQGWALVENTTDNDWTSVKLSLVSGRPVSFKMDLYEPMYVWRPEVAVPTVAGVMPREYGGAVGEAPETKLAREQARGEVRAAQSAVMDRADKLSAARSRNLSVNSPAPALAMPSAPAERDGYDLSGSNMADYAPKSVAKGGEVGEQFQYELASPITIERQRSAMIPIITSSIDARRVSIYNASDRADHPMRGVELTNATGGQLLPGPLAVFDSSAYAGDAQIGQVSAGDKRLLAYALDLDVAVSTKDASEHSISKLKIVKGMIEQSVVTRAGVTYTFDNKDLKRSRDIVLEHPKLAGYELKAPDKPGESTPDLYRFNVKAEPGKPAAITVTQERTEWQRLALLSYDTPTILEYSKSGKLSPGVADALRKAAGLNAAVADAERKLGETDRLVGVAKEDVEKATTQLQRLDRNNENYATLNKRLKDRLSKLESLESARQQHADALDAARRALDEYTRDLSVD